MNSEKAKQAFRKGQTAAEQTSRVRLTPDLGALKSGNGTQLLLPDLIRLLKQLNEQAQALGDPGREQVVTIELAGLSLTDIRLCDVEVKQKPSKPGVVPRKQQPAAMPPLSEAAERAVNADTLAILQERQQGQHSKHDDLEDRIKSCDNADHVRRLLVAVKKSWVTSHAGSEATSWGKLDGIRDYLPTRESATFQGVIREVGTGSRRMAMLELQADVDQTWRDAVERSTARATGYLKLRYATQETGDLLSRLHALKLPVQIEANVRMTLVDGAPADFCVSNARAWGVTEAEIETAVQKMVAELRFGLPAANDAEA